MRQKLRISVLLVSEGWKNSLFSISPFSISRRFLKNFNLVNPKKPIGFWGAKNPKGFFRS